MVIGPKLTQTQPLSRIITKLMSLHTKLFMLKGFCPWPDCIWLNIDTDVPCYRQAKWYIYLKDDEHSELSVVIRWKQQALVSSFGHLGSSFLRTLFTTARRLLQLTDAVAKLLREAEIKSDLLETNVQLLFKCHCFYKRKKKNREHYWGKQFSNISVFSNSADMAWGITKSCSERLTSLLGADAKQPFHMFLTK